MKKIQLKMEADLSNVLSQLVLYSIMNTQNIVISKDSMKLLASQGSGSDNSKRIYFSKQSMGSPLQFSTAPNFLSFSQKKSDMKEPLTFSKPRNADPQAHSKNSSSGSSAEGQLAMFKSQAPPLRKAGTEAFTSLSNLAKDASIEYGLLPTKNSEKEPVNSSNVLNRKQSMPNITPVTPLSSQTSTTPIINLTFKAKTSKVTRLGSP